MQQQTNDLLTKMLTELRTDVIGSMQAKGKIATGQTAQEIIIVNEGASVQLQLPGYLLDLEKGRPPTSKNAVSGNPPMIDRIKQWCQAKGIPGVAAWAVKRSIDKKGYKGTAGLLSIPLGDDNINLRVNQITNTIADIAADALLPGLNK